MTTIEELRSKIQVLFPSFPSEIVSLIETFEVFAVIPENYYFRLNEAWNRIYEKLKMFESDTPAGVNFEPIYALLTELLSLQGLEQSDSTMIIPYIISNLELALRDYENSVDKIKNENAISFFFSVLREGQTFVFEKLISKSSGICYGGTAQLNDAFGNLDNKVMMINGETILPDKNIGPCYVRDQFGNDHYFLSIYGKNVSVITYNNRSNPISIEIHERDSNFLQPIQWIFPVRETCTEEIHFKIDIRQSGRISDVIESKFVVLKRNEWKDFILKLSPKSITMKTYEIQNGEVVSVKIQFQPENDILVNIVENGGTIVGTADVRTFMWLDVTLVASSGGVYGAFNSPLTSSGTEQCKILEDQLLTISKIYRTGDSFYALFTSIIQSSGFGKSKICLELLKKYPGIYLVFRKKGETGIPHQIDWMKKLAFFVTEAAIDDLPLDILDIKNCKAIDYTPGRFLLILLKMIEAYFAKYSTLRTNNSRADAFKLVGSHMLLEPSDRLEFQFDIQVTLNENRTIDQIMEAIKLLVNSFSEITENHQMAINPLYREIMQPTLDSEYPFIVFIDEADNLSEIIRPGRLPMLNIIRRALHLLDINTRLLVVAIGTNCDALDFTPAVRDNSLRNIRRKNLLPPFILSCNWDIFSNFLSLQHIDLTRNLLLNRALFNILVSMGRPLWSSCLLSEVINIAQAKLKNGADSSLGALLALLLVRASLTINVHHVLSRNLIKSFMIIVNYISTDARDMKIGYSSEPVLAMASRRLLQQHSVREDAFRSMLDFLEKQAIDKGRVVETIFQHLTLFAIDDAPVRSEVTADFQNLQFTDDPSTLPSPQLVQLASCGSYLLKIQEERVDLEEEFTTANLNYAITKLDNYRVISVAAFIEGFIGLRACREVFEMLPSMNLNGLVNCSHYVNLDRIKPGDYEGFLENFDYSDKKRNIIDKSLLKVGLLRQCGFVMPESYPAIDFFVPYLFYNADGRPVYSFIAFQSKSSKTTIHECAFKMAAKIHVNQNPVGIERNDQNPRASFSDDEMNDIFENQLVFLLCLNNNSELPELTPAQMKSNISLKDIKIPKATGGDRILRNRAKEIRTIKARIINLSYRLYSDYLPDLVENEVIPLSYPAFRKGTADDLKPNIIFSKRIDPNLKIQKMVWNGPGQTLRTLTCIACFDVKRLGHLITEEGVEVIKRIANYSASMFDNVDSLHLGIVQNSSLYGKFSNYHLYNPFLRSMRSLNYHPINPIPSYFTNLTLPAVENSIKQCVIGPVDTDIQSTRNRVRRAPQPSTTTGTNDVDIEGFSEDEDINMEME